AIFLNESAQGSAETIAIEAADKHRQVDVPARFLPSAEGASGDVFFHAFGRPALESELPIVNCSGSVGGKMGYPPALDQPIDDGRAPILHQMRAVEIHHTRAPFARGLDFGGARRDSPLQWLSTGGR